MYRNGFTVGDGPLRDYESPDNKKFLSDMMKGYVPQELINQMGTDQIDVDLNDKRGEEYKEPPKPSFTSFSGGGTSLGGVPDNNPYVDVSNVDVKAEPPKVDKSKPTTRVQLRLHTGKTVEVELNLDTKVLELSNYAMSMAPVNGEFQLVGGFPPKPADISKTIEEAGLDDAKVIQKVL
mmetsp:Transcript_147419/g.209211  ORF Transcript_147419/g.209211 Transcript_147419/m.209211 type:complete len:179 (+) Transcript_147419:252-788(+)